MIKRLVALSIEYPRRYLITTALISVVFLVMAALPTVFPVLTKWLPAIAVDTDPENMLAENEEVRLFHHEMKAEFGLSDIIVMGVVNESDPEGVFNPRSLQNIFTLTEFAKTLVWPDTDDPTKSIGVITYDMITPSTVDVVSVDSPGSVRFEWLMPAPATTQADADLIRQKAMNVPFLKDTLISADGRAVAMYLPISSKTLSYKISKRLLDKAASLPGTDQYYVTGLPVAEDTFGIEMFKQMAISAPVAMLIIFVLLFIFFRKLSLIISPLIVALMSVIITMASLILTGHTIHIMSSMIPIFIMPIAVLDAVHILSEFYDRYQETKDRKKTILQVIDTLWSPMLFTSLTTAIGFASLALTPIPPVQVFGMFIALGVLIAWLLTITFIPASIMMIRQESLENFGLHADHATGPQGIMSRLLTKTGQHTLRFAKPLLFVILGVVLVSVYGMTMIRINDNPVKWFESEHPIRVADKVLNEHFGGTYMGYLALSAGHEPLSSAENTGALEQGIQDILSGKMEGEIKGSQEAAIAFLHKARSLAVAVSDAKAWVEQLEDWVNTEAEDHEALYEVYDRFLLLLSEIRGQKEFFKQPEILRYIENMQAYLAEVTDGQGRHLVGKSNSVCDLIKTVYRELMGGEMVHYRIPDSKNAVAQTLLQYESSHRPHDLWHFVSTDYRKMNIWLQLKSGDNQDMEAVVRAVDQFMKDYPAPMPLKAEWFGLTYINIIWQNKMVSGMAQAFAGSFLVVLLMMTFLFRSALWGFLCMIPLMVTIGFVYGVLGFAGKDYDMPVAVLSSLSLGLAVDYAIHFLARSRELVSVHRSWEKAVPHMFGEPGRAITRNVLVIGVGFLPLLLAPLVPYQTVGFLIAAILITAGIATLVILPVMIILLKDRLFPERAQERPCHPGTCLSAGLTFLVLVVQNLVSLTTFSPVMIAAISAVILTGVVAVCMRQRQKCRMFTI